MNALLNILEDTKLIERFSGVLVYLIIFCLSYIKIRQAGSRETVKRTLAVMTAALGFFAFFYIPGETADIFRWREISQHYWDDMPLGKFISGPMKSSDTPLAYLLFYFCQKTHIQGLLPMIVCVCYFIFISKIFNDYLSIEFDTGAAAIAFLFFMSSGAFLEVISGVRCFLSLAVSAWCIYTELVKGRPIYRNILWYVISATLHLAAIPVIAIRFVFLFINIIFEKRQKISDMVFTLSFIAAALIIGRKYIIAALKKGDSYLSNDKYTYAWEYIIGALQFAAIIIILFMFYKYSMTESKKRLGAYARFNVLMLLFVAAFCYEYTFFHRYIMLCSILIIPVAISSIHERTAENDYRAVNLLKMLSYVIFVIAGVRGNLCGFKFFEIKW